MLESLLNQYNVTEWNWFIFLDYGWFGQIILILSITSLMDDNGLITDDKFSQNLDTCKQQTIFQ